MRDADDVVYWLQERALRRYGATMNAAHTETQEWLWAEEITRLREENARLLGENWELVMRAHALLSLLPPETTCGQVQEARAKLAAIREGGKGE